MSQTLHTVTSAWDGTVTYSNQPTVSGGTALPIPVTGQWTEFDITPAVLSWIGGTPNHGVELRPNGTNNQWNEYRSLEYADPAFRPYLVVTYTTSGNASDTDKDRLPDAWESLYGFDTGMENFHVGNRADGSLTVAGGQTSYVNDTAIVISTAQAAGSREITGTLPSVVSIGDVFLLHVSQEGTPVAGSPAGTFELVQVTSLGTGKIGIRNPLQHTYDPASGAKIQCLRVPQFDHVQVDGALAARPWDGSTGGIVAMIADDVVVSAGGQISATGAGLRGGPAISVTGGTSGLAGKPGEGYLSGTWPLSNSSLTNNGGGAGGAIGATTGGGGSQLISQNSSFGGGGGSGGCNSYTYPPGTQGFTYFQNGGFGGTGGGFCLIISRSIILSGGISANGTEGEQASYESGFGYARSSSQGGGGAGGSLLLISRISGAGTISAASNTAGAGKVRVERGAVSSSPAAVSTGDGYFDSQTFSFLTTYNDADQDGLDDYGEFLAGTSPVNMDTDGDGVPDGWEVRFGTNPVVADANADPDQDGLTNLREFYFGSNPKSADGDGDGVSDVLELNVYGTNPISTDSDGDGMDDGWEIANSLNPQVNDADEDRDLDGLTNKQEYDQRASGFKANATNSLAGTAGDDHQSDYRRLNGEGWVRRRYDRNDRLISTERDNGLAQIYAYDGNSQKYRDVLTANFDADSDGLPDAWEFANNLAYSGTSAAEGVNGPLGDPDGDGFTNLAEWKANTDPHNAQSRPGTGSAVAGSPLVASTGFTPTNWVMATGQLDGYGADEVVVGADGVIGTSSNFVTVLRGMGDAAQSKQVSIGNIASTSLSIGPLAGRAGNQVVLGSRSATGNGQIRSLSPSGSTWNLDSLPIIESSAGNSSVIAGLANGRPVSALKAAGRTDTSIFCQDSLKSQWSAPGLILQDIDGETIPCPMGSSRVAAWKSNHELHVVTTTAMSAPGEALRQSVNDNALLSTSEPVTYGEAVAQAVSRNGSLVTIDSTAKNDFVRSNFGPGPLWLGLTKGYYAEAANPSSWTWKSGSSNPYRNWDVGQPVEIVYFPSDNFFYGPYPNRSMYTVIGESGKWRCMAEEKIFYIYRNFIEPNRFFGITEIPASASTQAIASPDVTKIQLWKGRTLASGQIRGSGSPVSLVTAFIDDKNSSNTADAGDDFLVVEYDLSVAIPLRRTLARISQTTPNPAGAYGITTVRRIDTAKPSALAVGEPDGTISLWSAADPISPLVRKVFSTEFKGKAWHQIEPLKEANGREGLVGLLVDPATPNQCRVIYWPSEILEAALSDTAPVLNHQPVARVLASPASGSSLSTVGVRIWDAEAHFSTIALQFQLAGQTNWTAAHLLSADALSGNVGGTGVTVALSSAPGGWSHSLVWNAAMDLGSSFAGSVFLRSKATDSEAGAWSEPILYTVDVTSDLDNDGDGFTNGQESAFGTDANSPTSRPFLAAVRNSNGSLQLTWPAAAGHTYRLETSLNLTQWTTLQSGLTSGSLILSTSAISDPKRFYRIAAE